MNCPSCEQPVYAGADHCPHCGFSYGDLKRQANGLVVRVPFLQDSAEVLSANGAAAVEKLIQKLHQEFIGVAIMVVLDDSPTETSAFDATFYLNEAEWTDDSKLPAYDSERFLLYINTHNLEARIALTYGLQKLTEKVKWEDVLMKQHALMFQGIYSEAVLAILKDFRKITRSCGKTSKPA